MWTPRGPVYRTPEEIEECYQRLNSYGYPKRGETPNSRVRFATGCRYTCPLYPHSLGPPIINTGLKPTRHSLRPPQKLTSLTLNRRAESTVPEPSFLHDTCVLSRTPGLQPMPVPVDPMAAATFTRTTDGSFALLARSFRPAPLPLRGLPPIPREPLRAFSQVSVRTQRQSEAARRVAATSQMMADPVACMQLLRASHG